MIGIITPCSQSRFFWIMWFRRTNRV